MASACPTPHIVLHTFLGPTLLSDGLGRRLGGHLFATVRQLVLDGALVLVDPRVPVLDKGLNLRLRNLVEDAELEDDIALCSRTCGLRLDGAVGKSRGQHKVCRRYHTDREVKSDKAERNKERQTYFPQVLQKKRWTGLPLREPLSV